MLPVGYGCTQTLVLVLILYWYGPRGRSFNGYGSCFTCGVRLYSDAGSTGAKGVVSAGTEVRKRHGVRLWSSQTEKYAVKILMSQILICNNLTIGIYAKRKEKKTRHFVVNIGAGQ